MPDFNIPLIKFISGGWLQFPGGLKQSETAAYYDTKDISSKSLIEKKNTVLEKEVLRDAKNRRIISKESLYRVPPDPPKEDIQPPVKPVKDWKQEQNANKNTQNKTRMQMKIDIALSQPAKIDKGASLMAKMGWQGGALGKTGTGITEPIIPNAAYAMNTVGFGKPAPTNKKSQRSTSVKKPMRPNKPQKNFQSNVLEYVLEFLQNDSEIELVFEKILTNIDRKRIHSIIYNLSDPKSNLCQITNIESIVKVLDDIHKYSYSLITQSEGVAEERFLCLSKEAPPHMYLITHHDLRNEAKDTVLNYTQENINKSEYIPNEMMFDEDEMIESKDFFINVPVRNKNNNLVVANDKEMTEAININTPFKTRDVSIDDKEISAVVLDSKPEIKNNIIEVDSDVTKLEENMIEEGNFTVSTETERNNAEKMITDTESSKAKTTKTDRNDAEIMAPGRERNSAEVMFIETEINYSESIPIDKRRNGADMMPAKTDRKNAEMPTETKRNNPGVIPTEIEKNNAEMLTEIKRNDTDMIPADTERNNAAKPTETGRIDSELVVITKTERNNAEMPTGTERTDADMGPAETERNNATKMGIEIERNNAEEIPSNTEINNAEIPTDIMATNTESTNADIMATETDITNAEEIPTERNDPYFKDVKEKIDRTLDDNLLKTDPEFLKTIKTETEKNHANSEDLKEKIDLTLDDDMLENNPELVKTVKAVDVNPKEKEIVKIGKKICNVHKKRKNQEKSEKVKNKKINKQVCKNYQHQTEKVTVKQKLADCLDSNRPFNQDEVNILILEYFRGFNGDEKYKEFKFLGPFEDYEVDVINDFISNVWRYVNDADYIRDDVFSILSQADCALGLKEDQNGSSVIYKIKDGGSWT